MTDLSIGGQQAHPISVAREQNRLKALELRGSGKKYREIASEMGVSLTTAHELVQEGLAELVDKVAETAEQVRTIELDRLDTLHGVLMTKLKLQRREMVTTDGQKVMVPDPNERTIESLLKVAERRARLMGIDAPTEISGPSGGPIPITNVGASDELMDRVEGLIKRVEAGEDAEGIAAAMRAAREEVEGKALPPSTHGVAS